MPAVRPRCPSCRRPPATCLCERVVPVPNVTPVLVLQHPLEAGHAKGTARLLHLSLARSRLEVGERFDDAMLRAWLPDGAVLLYPGEGGAPVPPHPGGIVVLDATWRKSRRMLAENPSLAALPRLSLDGLSPSRYTMRKAHRPEQRSTLEATLQALAVLEGPHAAHARLLAVLDAEQAEWARQAGRTVGSARAHRPCT